MIFLFTFMFYILVFVCRHMLYGPYKKVSHIESIIKERGAKTGAPVALVWVGDPLLLGVLDT